MNKWAKNIICFIVAILLMALLNFIKKDSTFDSVSKEIKLADTIECTETVDIAEFGILKYYLEPNVMTLSLKYKNVDMDSNYKCELNNLNASVYQGSRKSFLRNITSDDNLSVDEKGSLQIILEISVPRSSVYKTNISSGHVKLYRNDEVISDCTVNIINSKY